jgi:hypothetical protein
MPQAEVDPDTERFTATQRQRDAQPPTQALTLEA